MKNLILNVKTDIISQNVADFATQVKTYLAGINTVLKTDDDFAQAEADCKDLKAIEDNTRAAIKAVLEGNADVAQLVATAEASAEELRTTRLQLEKLVKAQKAQVRADIIARTKHAIHAQIDVADETIRPALRKVLRVAELDGILDEAAKGKKTLAGLEKGCASVLADWAALIQKSADYLGKRYAHIPADRLHLFPDLADVLAMNSGFEETVAARIAADDERQAAERARLEAAAKAKAEAAERARLEAAAKAKAEAEARARLEAEAREREQARAETAPVAEQKPVEQEQQNVTPQPLPQGDAEQADYIITLHCTLDQAKAIAKRVKDAYPQQFVKLKKGAEK